MQVAVPSHRREGPDASTSVAIRLADFVLRRPAAVFPGRAAFARRRGKDSFAAWVGAENVEMRVGEEWVDRQIVELARETGVSE